MTASDRPNLADSETMTQPFSSVTLEVDREAETIAHENFAGSMPEQPNLAESLTRPFSSISGESQPRRLASASSRSQAALQTSVSLLAGDERQITLDSSSSGTVASASPYDDSLFDAQPAPKGRSSLTEWNWNIVRPNAPTTGRRQITDRLTISDIEIQSVDAAESLGGSSVSDDLSSVPWAADMQRAWA
jgi:hypothetical protein